MEKKSLLNFLDEVSKERGFEKFSHSTDVGKVYVVEEIIKEAGKRYVNQYLEIAAENASISVRNNQEMDTLSLVASRNESRKYEVNKQSITNTDIDV